MIERNSVISRENFADNCVGWRMLYLIWQGRKQGNVDICIEREGGVCGKETRGERRERKRSGRKWYEWGGVVNVAIGTRCGERRRFARHSTYVDARTCAFYRSREDGSVIIIWLPPKWFCYPFFYCRFIEDACWVWNDGFARKSIDFFFFFFFESET